MKLFVHLTFIIATVTTAFADDWPRWRGPDFNGISRETDWQTTWPEADPPIVWKSNVGTGLSGISVRGGRLYTMGNNDNTDTVFCLDAESGQEIWSHSYPCALDPKYYEGGPGSTPTVDGDTVFTLSREGQLFSFDANTGTVRWSVHLVNDLGLPAPGWGFNGSPLATAERLFLNAGSAGLALNKKNGQTAWTSAPEEAGYSSPFPLTRNGATELLVSARNSYSGVDPNTGVPNWSLRWLTRYGVNAADPVPLGDDRLFISSGYDKGATVIQLGRPVPNEIWKSKVMRNQMNPCILIDGFLYGVDGNEDGDTDFKCLEASSGNLMWSDNSTGMSGAIAANGHLLILGERGELIIAPASPDGFEPTTRVQVLGGKSWTAPTLADGRIYCRNIRGDLVCVDLR